MDKTTKFAGSSRLAGSRSTSRAGSQLGGTIATSSSSKLHLGRSSRSFLGSRNNLHSSSKYNLGAESNKQLHRAGVRIWDNEEDVTPLPLIQQPELTVAASRKSHSTAAGGGGGAMDSQVLFAPGNASFMQPFSRSVFAASVASASTAGVSTMGSMMGSMTDEMTSSRPLSHTEYAPLPDREEDEDEGGERSQELTIEELDKPVEITLQETETLWLLDIPSTWLAINDEEADSVREKNRQYEELVKSRPGNDRYSERGMQTLNNSLKTKIVQTERIGKVDAEVYASTWDVYDTLEALQQVDQSGEEDEAKTTTQSSKLTSRAATASTMRGSRVPTAPGTRTVTPSTIGSTVTGTSIFVLSEKPDVTMFESTMGAPRMREEREEEEEEEEKLDPTKPNSHPILQLDSLMDSLRVAERAVTLNIYQPKQAIYRGLPVLHSPDHQPSLLDNITARLPHLNKLWAFSCPITKGHAVTCMAWNPANLGIIAVGFGELKGAAAESSSGLICCWSLKNPEHPERVFHSPSGVTSIAFSSSHPNLLAAGLYNGSIVLYNARSTSHEPVLTSRDALFKHSGPVWRMEWVMKERSYGESKTEVLVSTATDGRVLQWSIQKGFEISQLIRLKRMLQPRPVDKKIHHTKSTLSHHASHKQQKQMKHQQKAEGVAVLNPGREALLSQHAPGMGFTFCPSDTNIYLVCTEEGHIHKCSISYNEQFLETYHSHTGPVYKVLWHPLHKDVFLSCSTDWTVRLWHQEKHEPLHTFQIAQKSEDRKGNAAEREAVGDIDWCPSHSTMFGCVTGARIELWDFNHSIIDPLVTHRPISGAKQTCLLFSHDSNVLLVGDSIGQVSVYQPKNYAPPATNQTEALLSAIESLQTESTIS